MKNPKLLFSDKFICSGVRGPVLEKIIWDAEGLSIEKIIFEGNLSIKFIGLQTVMITPHEVYGYNDFPIELPAGVYDLGHSQWFKSMNDLHLVDCNHYKLFFYDQIIDVICEDIVIGKNV